MATKEQIRKQATVGILSKITSIFHWLILGVLFPFKLLFQIVLLFKKIFLWLFRKRPSQEISKGFNRRRFERPFEEIEIVQEDLGFTNRVLFESNKKTTIYYVPVYITCKIKSIQDVSVQNLTGNISCAMIINIAYGDLPEEIVDKMTDSILVQLNRGDTFKLEADDIQIKLKKDSKNRFLVFTIRKVFLALLVGDPLWAPFDVVELIVSVTLNTLTITPHSLQLNEESSIDPSRQYKVSFNCMRNSYQIPVSYSLDCVFGIYDLAQKKLQSYHTRYSTYSEIQHLILDEKNKVKKSVSSDKQARKMIDKLLTNAVQKFCMRTKNSQTKTPAQKVKYFQYTHFVVPLYKYPGNSIATIFIPIFLLALVSLAIFFQEREMSGRIGAIATLILGYISLIPSIKQQLPPSSKLTIIQTVVYIQTVCCLLCLWQTFMIHRHGYAFVWHQSWTFLTSLTIHSFTFFFVFGVYIIHKIIWEPAYNSNTKVPELRPQDNLEDWDNPFCDQIFLKYNQKISKNTKYSSEQKREKTIRPLEEVIKIQVQEKQSELFESIGDVPQLTDKKKSFRMVAQDSFQYEQDIAEGSNKPIVPIPPLTASSPLSFDPTSNLNDIIGTRSKKSM